MFEENGLKTTFPLLTVLSQTEECILVTPSTEKPATGIDVAFSINVQETETRRSVLGSSTCVHSPTRKDSLLLTVVKFSSQF